jgi:hypothetical protein
MLKSIHAPVRPGRCCAAAPSVTVNASTMSPFSIAIDPDVCVSRIAWTGHGTAMPSIDIPMWAKSLPRIENSLRKSLPAETLGSDWIARNGSSVSTPRRSLISALPSACWTAAPDVVPRNGSATTVTASVKAPVPSASGIVISVVACSATSTVGRARPYPTSDT